MHPIIVQQHRILIREHLIVAQIAILISKNASTLRAFEYADLVTATRKFVKWAGGFGKAVEDPTPNASRFYYSDFDLRPTQNSLDRKPQDKSTLRAFEYADLVTATGRFSEWDPTQNPSRFYSAYPDFDSRPPQNSSDTNPQNSSTLRAYEYADLVTATRNFDESSNIGAGRFGNVYKGVVKSLERPFNDIRVAVKRGKRGRQGYKQWEREVKMLGEIKHPNLVKLIGYCNEESGYKSNILVYEYMPNESLDDHLSGKKTVPLSWATKLNIALDAATGLTYLHEGMGVGHQIIFRDFKPSNILLDGEMKAKLSDFGFAREDPHDGWTHCSTTAIGTKKYAAPEYVQTGHLTSKIDVWSYGIFLEELIAGGRPFKQNASENINPQCSSWLCCYAGSGKSKLIVDPRFQGKYSEKPMQQLAFIANKCLAKEPELRPIMSEVLEMVKHTIAMHNQLPNGGRN